MTTTDYIYRANREMIVKWITLGWRAGQIGCGTATVRDVSPSRNRR